MCVILDSMIDAKPQKVVRMKPFIVKVDRLPGNGNVLTIRITSAGWQMVWDAANQCFEAQKWQGDNVEIGYEPATAKPKKTPDNKVVHSVDDVTASVVAVGIPQPVAEVPVQTFKWTWADGFSKSFEVALVNGQYLLQAQDIPAGHQDPPPNAPSYWMSSTNLFNWGPSAPPTKTLIAPKAVSTNKGGSKAQA